MKTALIWVICAGVVGCADVAPDVDAPEPRFEFGCPNDQQLACTGLYGDAGEHWFSKQPGEGVDAFEPGVALWSDHMEKRRFVWLPPGTVIDGSDPDSWRFPIGTKFWKEFAYQGKRIETRYLEKRDYDWYAATFRWSETGAEARLLTEGEQNVPGTLADSYEIPPTKDCKRCHAGAKDHVLGFSAIVMADERSSGLTLSRLQASGRIAPPQPESKVPGTPVEQAALRYLHVNCGVSCHNPSFEAEAWWTGFYMKMQTTTLDDVPSTAVFKTGVGVMSYVPDPSLPAVPLALIAPGDPSRSAVVYRDSERGSTWQMPPLATHAVDESGLLAVKTWIAAMPR